MLFMHGCAKGKITEAVRLYKMRFPNRHYPIGEHLNVFTGKSWRQAHFEVKNKIQVDQDPENDKLNRNNPGGSEQPT